MLLGGLHSIILFCYLGKLPVVGALHLPVKQGCKQANRFLYVVDYPGPLGHDMIHELQLLSTEHVNSLQPLDINVDTMVKAEERPLGWRFDEGSPSTS